MAKLKLVAYTETGGCWNSQLYQPVFVELWCDEVTDQPIDNEENREKIKKIQDHMKKETK